MEEAAVDCLSTADVVGTAEVTQVKLVVAEAAVYSVFRTVASGEVEAGSICEVVSGVWLTMEMDEVLVFPEGEVS